MKPDDKDVIDRAILWTAISVACALIGVCMMVVLTLAFSRAEAQDLVPCIARGRVAYVLVMGVGQGVPLEQLDIYFHMGKQLETDKEWVNGIKEEVRPLLGAVPAADSPDLEPYANKIASKIAQACAYKLGTERRT